MSETPEAPDAADEALLAELTALLARVDPPPADLVERSAQLFTWRTVDAELAALGHDSLLEAPAPALRSGGGQRMVTFETPALVIEVEVADGGGGRRLVGQLDPAGPAELVLRSADTAPVTAVADELGRFVLPLPPEPRRVSLRCVRAAGGAVETAWVTL